MKIIILAAGYATRLYPLTLNIPKPLLLVDGKPIIEYLLERLGGRAGVEEGYIVTNEKFNLLFEQWLRIYEKQTSFPLKIINDKSVDEKSKLGAIGDINFVLSAEKINDDVIIVAGDNLPTDSLQGFAEFGLKKNMPVVGITSALSLEEVKRLGSVKIDDNGQIIFFEEKPKVPKSEVVSAALYFYPRNLLPRIQQYLEEGNNPDQPGRFVEWLYQRMPVFTWRIQGHWFDVGTHESLALAEKYMKELKTILVTGGAGYIGSHAVKRLLKEGYPVVVFDNFSRGFKEPLEILKKYGDLQVLEGDLTHLEDVRKIFQMHKIDTVMHFAAFCSVDESMKNPELYFKNNVSGTSNLLEAMQEFKVDKIIFSSTCAVYGNAEYLPIDEKHPTKPVNPYGESKLLAEKLFSRISGLNYIILRYFNVCGADNEGEIGDSKKPSELLVQNAVRGALHIEPFALTCPTVDTPDGTPIRDYIDVEDLIEAHMKAFLYLNKGGKSTTINLGNGKGWSVKEIVGAVEKELEIKLNIITGATPRQGEYKEVYANIDMAKKVLGWQPKRSLPDSVQSLKKWYNDKPNGYKK